MERMGDGEWGRRSPLPWAEFGGQARKKSVKGQGKGKRGQKSTASIELEESFHP